ncbi:hypothetical protein LMG28688_00735 [Paraburkholderia caffeinitolerans]|uniref:Uncharacterized protein n=1 Tax=Paraburkholderia caffeinitolerans TaxID=1723730 RepID=A0A6J5FJR8_9BURK|nr:MULTISPECIES: hypothetical protein [Paraburkholderia]CAB3779129.1 hypothetical protein LMG28688_00735 [Paraburkholderia caffeinitolerans]
MEIVVIAAIIAVGFGAAATWLIATRLPAEWIERGQTEGRYAALSTADDTNEAPDPHRVQARTDSRRVRRARVRALPAAALMRRLRTHPDGGAQACGAPYSDSTSRPPRY